MNITPETFQRFGMGKANGDIQPSWPMNRHRTQFPVQFAGRVPARVEPSPPPALPPPCANRPPKPASSKPNPSPTPNTPASKSSPSKTSSPAGKSTCPPPRTSVPSNRLPKPATSAPTPPPSPSPTPPDPAALSHTHHASPITHDSDIFGAAPPPKIRKSFITPFSESGSSSGPRSLPGPPPAQRTRI